MTANAISVTGLRKSYGDHEAVRGIDLEVRQGEVFGFLGPNGAGKTTTIEILEGYRQRSGGEISVLGADPGRPTRAWRERIGLVLQECELDPLLTVRETVTLFSSFYSRPRNIPETIEMVGLGPKIDARAGSLSGGQKRRLDVAVGIIGNPELLFLDEPTTGFDPTARRDAWNMIEGLKAAGTTIFLTTHYMDEAQHLADRVAILRSGEIVAKGRPGDLGSQFGGDGATISFRMPEGVGAEEVGSAIGIAPSLSGNSATLRSRQAQHDLYRLLQWAEGRSLDLGDLEVRRASLEDIFLELTSDSPQAEDGQDGSDERDGGR